MSDNNNGKSQGPSHHAFQVREGKEGKSFFNRVGSAFEHKDGQGFNIILESIPVDGKVTLRTPSERLKEMKEGSGKEQSSQTRERE
jgi:hypothetical protein